MAGSNTRMVLTKARFFLTRAEVEEAEIHSVDDRLPFLADLEAAIVWGRSITLHLQKEFARQAGFNNWYEPIKCKLGNDPICDFLLGQRNFILKEGPAAVRRTLNVTVNSVVNVSVSYEAEIIRAQPWYRRRPMIIWFDLIYPLRQRLHKWRESRRKEYRTSRREDKARQATSVSQRSYFHFVDPPWNEQPALNLVKHYLDTLEQIVRDAEATFLYAR
jgi:hypothetical protein